MAGLWDDSATAQVQGLAAQCSNLPCDVLFTPPRNPFLLSVILLPVYMAVFVRQVADCYSEPHLLVEVSELQPWSILRINQAAVRVTGELTLQSFQDTGVSSSNFRVLGFGGPKIGALLFQRAHTEFLVPVGSPRALAIT